MMPLASGYTDNAFRWMVGAHAKEISSTSIAERGRAK